MLGYTANLHPLVCLQTSSDYRCTSTLRPRNQHPDVSEDSMYSGVDGESSGMSSSDESEVQTKSRRKKLSSSESASMDEAEAVTERRSGRRRTQRKRGRQLEIDNSEEEESGKENGRRGRRGSGSRSKGETVAKSSSVQVIPTRNEKRRGDKN